MANEYTLRLKAQLDTSQVQQQLEKLNSVKSEIGTGAANGFGPVGGNINTALLRLNQILTRLNSNIERLGSTFGKTQSAPNTRGTTPFARGQVVQGTVDLMRRHEMSRAWDEAYRLKRAGDFAGATEEFNKAKELFDLDKKETDFVNEANLKVSNRFTRAGVGWLAADIFPALVEWQKAKGNTGFATGASIFGSIGQKAAMGGLITGGNPLGIAAGLGVGILEETFKALAKSAQEAASKLEELKKASLAGIQTQNTYQKTIYDKEFNLAYGKKDKNWFADQLSLKNAEKFTLQNKYGAYWGNAAGYTATTEEMQKRANAMSDVIKTGNKSFVAGALVEETQANQEKKALLDEIAARQAIAEAGNKALKEWQDLTATTDKLQSSYEALIEAERKEAEATQKLAEQKQKEAELEQRKIAQLDKSATVELDKYRARQNGFNNEAYAKSISKLSPYEQFTLLGEKLDQARAQRADYERKAQIYLTGSLNSGLNSEEKGSLQEVADDFARMAENMNPAIAALEQALGSIKLDAGSGLGMSSWQSSMARYGMYMGEQDLGTQIEQSQLDVQKSIETLVRDIRDKLDSKDSYATYGE